MNKKPGENEGCGCGWRWPGPVTSIVVVPILTHLTDQQHSFQVSCSLLMRSFFNDNGSMDGIAKRGYKRHTNITTVFSSKDVGGED